eukprot:12894192-Alexandrium_andersonii.AAC.1
MCIRDRGGQRRRECSSDNANSSKNERGKTRQGGERAGSGGGNRAPTMQIAPKMKGARRGKA